MGTEYVELIEDGPIATMVLNRPDKRNAMNEAMWRAIAEHADDVAGDAAIKVMIIKGVDDTAFSAGADISEFGRVHASPETANDYRKVVDAAYQAVAGLEKPTIAMIQGVCFGGGCALSLCCDLRYADPTASFCIPPAKLGLVYSIQETKRLADLIGPSKAKEMLMGAYVVEADEALRIGLATRLFQTADLETEAYRFARRLTDLSQATIKAVKVMLGEIMGGATGDTEISRRLVRGQFESADYIEGRNAFMEKRKPEFS
jgi:enoyl-CoA hydratase/carnithine racemase